MTDYMDIGPGPCTEQCAQVGDPGYHERSLAECRAFKNQLLRQFPPPVGASIVVRSHAHDFGTYREVAVKYHVDNEEASDYAYKMESEFPERWDDDALLELGLPPRETA